MTSRATKTFEITFDAPGGDQYHAQVTITSEWDDEGVYHDVTICRIVNDHGEQTDGRVSGEQYAQIVASAEESMGEYLDEKAKAAEEYPYS